MSRRRTTKDENFIDAPSRSATGGGSRTAPRINSFRDLFEERGILRCRSGPQKHRSHLRMLTPRPKKAERICASLYLDVIRWDQAIAYPTYIFQTTGLANGIAQLAA